MKKVITFLVVMFVFAGLLAGCGPGKEVRTPAQELVIGVGRDFYDGPESSNFVHGSTGVWESLTYLNESLEPVP